MLNRLGKVLIIVGTTIFICAIMFLLFTTQTQRILFEGAPFVSQESSASQVVENENIIIPGFKELLIPPDETTVSAFLYNPPNNSCYFQIYLLLRETKEVIYESKMLAPGHAIHELELSRTFTEGEYEAIIQYRAFSASDFSDLNGANMPFKLIVTKE